ncbi:hypothetical protein BB560_004483, partial [Smittium megazygosporum]
MRGFYVFALLGALTQYARADCQAEPVFAECVARQNQMLVESCSSADLACQCYWYNQIRTCFELCPGDDTKNQYYNQVITNHNAVCSQVQVEGGAQRGFANPDTGSDYMMESSTSDIPSSSSWDSVYSPQSSSMSMYSSWMPTAPTSTDTPSSSSCDTTYSPQSSSMNMYSNWMSTVPVTSVPVVTVTQTASVSSVPAVTVTHYPSAPKSTVYVTKVESTSSYNAYSAAPTRPKSTATVTVVKPKRKSTVYVTTRRRRRSTVYTTVPPMSSSNAVYSAAPPPSSSSTVPPPP